MPDLVVSTMMPPADPPYSAELLFDRTRISRNRLDRRIEVDLALPDPEILTGSAVDPEHLALRTASRQAEIGVGVSGRVVVANEHGSAGQVDHIQRSAIPERDTFDTLRFDQLCHVRAYAFRSAGASR